MSFHKLPSLLGLAILVSGCSLAPDYQQPGLPVAANWSGNDTEIIATQQNGWDTFVTDEVLRQLINTALENNRSFRQVLLDIESARAQYRIQRAERLPQLDATGTGSRQQVPASLSGTGATGINSNYQVGLSLPDYELDLFARVKNLSDAALEQYLATDAGSKAAQVALIAEVIQVFLTYESTQQRLILIRQTAESRQKSLALTEQRRILGDASALDYQEAYGLLQQAGIEQERVNREHLQARNALILLLGIADTETLLSESPRAQKLVLQDIGAGTPSLLIANRADIQASEHRLKARHADIGAARAAFFPRISLTGNIGTASSEISGLFGSGSRAWSFVPQISLPIFAGDRNRANLTLAQVRKDIAIAEYEYQIQTAFREVADALAATDTLRREEESQSALAASAEKTMQLAEARYRGGIDSHLRYMEAQRQNFAAQSSMIEVNTQRQIALVDLFRALGGNWYAEQGR